jgi:nucleoside-diphosphate-sugar epimerase
MRILITGADTRLGRAAAAALRAGHDLRLTGAQPDPPEGAAGLPYTPADLREPDEVTPLLEGVEAVLHLVVYEPFPTPDAAAEKEALDRAARGTFVLLHAGLAAGVRRVVLASRLELMAAYPEHCAADETWKPQPDADAASLAPYVAELTLREFVRAEALTGVCLRFGPLGPAPDGTTEADAVRALERALTMDLEGRKYRWWLYHVCSTDRYDSGAASRPPLGL